MRTSGKIDKASFAKSLQTCPFELYRIPNRFERDTYTTQFLFISRPFTRVHGHLHTIYDNAQEKASALLRIL